MFEIKNNKASATPYLLILIVISIALISIVNQRMMNELDEMSQLTSTSSQVQPTAASTKNDVARRSNISNRQIPSNVSSSIKKVSKLEGRRRFDSAERRAGKVKESPLLRSVPLVQ